MHVWMRVEWSCVRPAVAAGMVGGVLDPLADGVAHGMGAALRAAHAHALIDALPCRVTALAVCKQRGVLAAANDM